MLPTKITNLATCHIRCTLCTSEAGIWVEDSSSAGAVAVAYTARVDPVAYNKSMSGLCLSVHLDCHTCLLKFPPGKL